MNYLFIVGCPRSGTTWIAWLLAQHPEVVVALHSGFVQGLGHAFDQLDRPASLGNRVLTGTSSGRQASLGELVQRHDLAAASRPLLRTLLDGAARADERATWVVEKTPENLLSADLVRVALPEARFLHIVRDPRAVFSSVRSAAKKWAYPGDMPTSPITLVRRFWLRYLEAGDRLAREIPDQYLQIRYEDLSSDGPATLARVFDWLSLELGESRCREIVETGSVDRLRAEVRAPQGFFHRGTPDGWRGDLGRRPVRIIEHLAGDRMAELGYDRLYPNARRPPAGLGLVDRLGGLGRRLARGPLGNPLRWLLGRARRSAETLRNLTTDT